LQRGQRPPVDEDHKVAPQGSLVFLDRLHTDECSENQELSSINHVKLNIDSTQPQLIGM
jgi:hypothetical protein